jgi:hypothetical protein
MLRYLKPGKQVRVINLSHGAPSFTMGQRGTIVDTLDFAAAIHIQVEFRRTMIMKNKWWFYPDDLRPASEYGNEELLNVSAP